MKSLALALLFVSVSLSAANVTVDCTGATPGAFTSINTALATLDSHGANTVNVSGTCVENVVIATHDFVTIQGSPSAVIQSPGGFAVRIDRCRAVVLRALTVVGGARVLRNSDVQIENVTIQGGGVGLAVEDGSIATLGGSSAAQAVLIHGSNTGASVGGATLRANGNVTIENCVGHGIDAGHSRVGFFGSASAPNIVRNNGANGVVGHDGSDILFGGVNEISGNTLNGLFVYESSTMVVNGTPAAHTTIDGNLRGGVVYLLNSSGRVQSAVISNNGSADPLSSGVTVANNSSAFVNFSTITGSTGPGAIVDSGSMARLNSSTISGGTAEPIRLLTGGILELQTGNTITGVGKHVVVCDDSAVLFGDGAAVSTSCKKTK